MSSGQLEGYSSPPFVSSGEESGTPLTLCMVKMGSKLPQRGSYELVEEILRLSSTEIICLPLRRCSQGCLWRAL